MSAHVDVFQAYLGAAAIDSGTGMEAVDIFVSALLDCEPESAFELNGAGSGLSGSSVAASSSAVTQAFHASNVTSIVSTPRESPAPPQYDLGVRKPLGAAESDSGGSGELKMEDESSLGDSSTSNGTGKAWDSNASSVVMRPPQHIVPSPPPVIPASSPSFVGVQRTQLGSSDLARLATMQKKALAQFNEICAKRQERPDWDFTASGPAHSRSWEARLLCASYRPVVLLVRVAH